MTLFEIGPTMLHGAIIAEEKLILAFPDEYSDIFIPSASPPTSIRYNTRSRFVLVIKIDWVHRSLNTRLWTSVAWKNQLWVARIHLPTLFTVWYTYCFGHCYNVVLRYSLFTHPCGYLAPLYGKFVPPSYRLGQMFRSPSGGAPTTHSSLLGELICWHIWMDEKLKFINHRLYSPLYVNWSINRFMKMQIVWKVLCCTFREGQMISAYM